MQRKMSTKRVMLKAVAAAALVYAGAVGADTHYAGSMEATRWQLDASVFACKLYQPLDQFGEAVFLHRAGEDQRFYLAAHNRLLAAGPAAIEAFTPLWQPVHRAHAIDSVSLEGGAEPLQLDWRDSQALVNQLHRGMQLAVTAYAWHDASQQVSLVMAPTGFEVGFRDFLACTNQLLPANYDQISRSSVHFLPGAVEFEDDQRQVLDHLVRYVLAEPHVTALVIDGHSDGMGLRADNLALSQQRAEAVHAYITERGVPEELVQVRWHGERYPIASNRTPEGRAENRRVTLRVDRFEPEQLAEK